MPCNILLTNLLLFLFFARVCSIFFLFYFCSFSLSFAFFFFCFFLLSLSLLSSAPVYSPPAPGCLGSLDTLVNLRQWTPHGALPLWSSNEDAIVKATMPLWLPSHTGRVSPYVWSFCQTLEANRTRLPCRGTPITVFSAGFIASTPTLPTLTCYHRGHGLESEEFVETS